MKDVTLTIRNNPLDGDDSFDKLLEMLAWMDICSSIGHNTKFMVEYYGDYDARFHFDILENSERYNEIKKQILNRYINDWTQEPYEFRIG